MSWEMPAMPSFSGAIRGLNQLRREGLIRDYVVIGAVGALAYLEPVRTEDLDIIVLVDTDHEYLQMFRRLVERAESMDGMHLYFSGIPVQVFPSTISQLYRETLEQARTIRSGNLKVKVPTPEHLVLLALLAFRDADQLRVVRLLPRVDRQKLEALLRRYDDATGTLQRRLGSLSPGPEAV
jgi:hypothetical protein